MVKQQKGGVSLTQPCANSAWSALPQDITTNQDTKRRASELQFSASLPWGPCSAFKCTLKACQFGFVVVSGHCADWQAKVESA